MYCNPELRKAIAFSLFIKTRVKSSAVQRWSINKLHEITGVSACAVRKRIDTLKALGLVEFTGKNNRCLVFKSLKSHTSHRNVLVPNIEFISRNDSKKNAYAQNVKFIEDTLSAMLIIDVQNRKNYAKQMIQQSKHPKGLKELKAAKKIMRRNTPYWIFRYLCYNRILLPGAGYKVDFKDHRITKTISLISKKKKNENKRY